MSIPSFPQYLCTLHRFVFCFSVVAFGTAITPRILHAQSVAPAGITLHFGGLGTDGANAIVALSDGGFALAGWKTLDQDRSVTESWVVRVDHRGGYVWDLQLPNSAPYGVTALSPAFDGGLYVVDGERGDKSGTTRLSKISPEGATEFQLIYGSSTADTLSALRPTFDGGLILAGRTLTRGAAHSDGWVVKLDRSQAVEWFRVIGGPHEDGLEDVSLSTDGGYTAVGWTTQENGHVTGWSLKLSGKGATEWEAFHDLGIDTEFHRVLPASSGGTIAAATTRAADGEGRKIIVLEIDATGQKTWQQGISSPGTAMATGLAHRTMGGYLLSASIEDRRGAAGLTAGIESDGTLDFIHRHSGSGAVRALAITATPNDGYAVAGTSAGQRTLDQDVWLLINDSLGSRKPKE
jgi:hypothetical protein